MNLELAKAGTYDDGPRRTDAFISVYQSLITFTQTIIVGLWNVIQAVIVDKQAQVRESDLTLQTAQHGAERLVSKLRLQRMFNTIDVDGNSSLTWAEMLQGYDELEDFRQEMAMLDNTREISSLYSKSWTLIEPTTLITTLND